MDNEEEDSSYHENLSSIVEDESCVSGLEDESCVSGNAQHLDNGNSEAHPDVNIVCKERNDPVHDSSALKLRDCLCKDSCCHDGCRFDEGLSEVQEHPLKSSSWLDSGLDVDGVSANSGKKQSKGAEVKESQILKGNSREYEAEQISEMKDGSHNAEEFCASTCLGHTGNHFEIDKHGSLDPVAVDTCENEGLPTVNKESKEQDRKFRGLSSPPLKLTFKTVGQITTCSINDTGDSRIVSNQQVSQKQLSSSVSKEKTNVWETDLMDSSDESDFDMWSNPRSTALSVSSVSDLFENSIGSPCKDVVPEPGAEIECQSDFYCGKEEKVRPNAVFNENLIKLSPACEGTVEKIGKVSLACVPARSAAVKAMTKMKPDVEKDLDLDDVEDKCAGPYPVSKKYGVKSKQSLTKVSPSISEESLYRNHPKDMIKSSYSCSFCSEMKAVTLQKIRFHLISQHREQPPIITHVRQQRNSMKKRRFYICLLSSCKKLFKNALDLDSHKAEHHISLPAKPKERKTMNSLSTSSVSSITQVLPPPVSLMHNETENIPITDCCVKLRYLDTAQLNRYCGTHAGEKNEVGKYECLYCTESFCCDTLSEIKQHYFSEHPSQLLVLRDVEAKRSQLPSRIYVCDDTGCDFQSTCRSEIMAHSGCHNTNCTCVYECPSCGWYSSSYGVAEDHVKEVHADEENISLVRMQLSVDENGQTSKKILR